MQPTRQTEQISSNRFGRVNGDMGHPAGPNILTARLADTALIGDDRTIENFEAIVSCVHTLARPCCLASVGDPHSMTSAECARKRPSTYNASFPDSPRPPIRRYTMLIV